MRKIVLALLFAIPVRADFLFEYEVEYEDGDKHLATVILPDYFRHSFGIIDANTLLIRQQEEHPIDPARIEKTKRLIQAKAWWKYTEEGVFDGSVYSDRYKLYRMAETLLDNRSAIVAVTSLDRVAPGQMGPLEGLFRATSAVPAPAETSPLTDLFPYEIYGLGMFEAEEAIFNRPRMGGFEWKKRRVPMVPFLPLESREDGYYSVDSYWLDGWALETKNWIHSPKPAKGRQAHLIRRSLQDLIYQLVQMHKLLYFTGFTLDQLIAAHPEDRPKVEQMVRYASAMEQRPRNFSDIGIRAAELRAECLGEKKRDGYVQVFGAEPWFDYYNQIFENRMFVLKLSQEQLEAHMPAFLRQSRRFKLKPRFQLRQRNIPPLPARCPTRLESSQDWWTYDGVQAVMLGTTK